MIDKGVELLREQQETGRLNYPQTKFLKSLNEKTRDLIDLRFRSNVTPAPLNGAQLRDAIEITIDKYISDAATAGPTAWCNSIFTNLAYAQADHDRPLLALLDDVAFVGKFFIFEKARPKWAARCFISHSEDYHSSTLQNPTWRQLIACCDKSIKTLGDYCHFFLDDIYVTTDVDAETGATRIEIACGS